MNIGTRSAIAALISCSTIGWAHAQDASSNAPAGVYEKPPRAILDVMHAPAPPTPLPSPTRDRILLATAEDYPSMSRVARPYLKLAGVRLEPDNRAKHDTPAGYGIVTCIRSMSLVTIADRSEAKVDLAGAQCPTHVQWSADGERFAFQNIAAGSVELWVGDARSATVKRIPGVKVNQIFEGAIDWMPDQRTLLVRTVPADIGPPPAKPDVPGGPVIQESTGQKGESSTYETRDTLRNAYDERLFDYYGASQMMLVDTVSGRTTPIGKRDLYLGADPAPDGKHVLVMTLRRPYSYVTTFDRFPRDVDVWDISSGQARVAFHVASLPLADRVPVRGVRLGPRSIIWRSTEPATLVWAEALDGGDWKTKVPERDKVMIARAPFDKPPLEYTRMKDRYGGMVWGEKPELGLLSEYDINRKWQRTYIVNVDDAAQPRRVLFDQSLDERYKNPGSPVMRRLPNGAPVMFQQDGALFLRGSGASLAGDRPFLDRLDIATLKTERLFRSERTAYEVFVGFDKSSGSRTFVTWHQTATAPPNAFVRTLGAPVADAQPGEAAFASSRTQVTRIEDPTPVVREIKKRLVKYKRADGVDLSFTLYTPPGYKEGTRVPTILYAYPLDFAEPAMAGQVSGTENSFTRLRLHRLLLLAGYALVDMASFPIVGDPRTAYDTYLEQLVADAKAAVDEAVRLGVADPDRIGVTGHSHGALMTVNLVAHTDLFRAGVASSGSYNKVITPFGFQNERRSVWDAQDVYLKVSPYFMANKMKAPLLLVHGADDANPGTTPMQSQFLYEAIRGNGGIVRLAMLPNEPHWYTARESQEHFVAEMVNWFDKYVKNAAPRAGRGG